MATRAIKPRRDDSSLRHWPSLPERAPSILRQDQPTPGRVIALVSFLLVAMGGLGMLAPGLGLRYIVGVGWGQFWFVIGVGGLLFHAFNEHDVQFRRLYGFLGGYGLLAAGIALRVWPTRAGLGGMFFAYGVPCLGLALPFLLSFARNETEAVLRQRTTALIGLAGAAMALAGFFFGSTNQAFLLGEGVILIVFGLVYLAGFIGLEGTTSPRAFYSGLGLGAVGFIILVLAFTRSFLLRGPSYFVPDGLVLMAAGLVYLFVSLCVCSDWTFIVLLRRELGSFFFSPVAYLVILGFVLVGWYQFWNFTLMIKPPENIPARSIPEPFIIYYIFGLVPVLFLIFAIPMLTMRLISEEQRTGTWEVLLTAPIGETSVVLSKFFAVWFFFLLGTASWGINLIALRAMEVGEQSFDSRPMLSFYLTLACTGAGFISMGLFFSSLTRNQIISAVLTFASMLLFTGFYVLPEVLPRPWSEIVDYISYLRLWQESLRGMLSPRHLLVFISLAILFLFLTVKVLESRKWK